MQRLEGLVDPRQGLSAAEAQARLARYGPNAIIPGIRSGWRTTLADTLRDPMLWFLLATGALFTLIGSYTEALVMLLALVPLFGMDAYLHRRTQASVEGLSGRLATTARVLRDGAQQTVAAEGLVPGDLVLVNSGEFFPADGLIVAGEELQVDESTLTGEAWPVRKQVVERARPATTRETSVEEVHWGLAGTRLLTGHAWLRIALTGAETLYGEVVRSAVAGTHAQTPLQRSVAHLVKVLIVAAIVFCLALAWLRYHQGHGLVDALLSALTLAIAALPEEFPVVLTFFLGVGVYRLARRHALVRRSLVVENIGRVTCICSDKTGTLTEGRLRLTHLRPAPGLSEARLRGLAAAASQADSGDPLDEAVLADCPPAEARLVARFPFTEDRRKATMVSAQADGLLVAVKGAPEVVLGLCELPESDRGDWLAAVETFSNDGHKVIGCAYRTLAAEAWTGGEPDRELHFAGLLAFEDPVRRGVPEAVAACRAAGIRVIMVTGDHPGTAIAIARELGLGGEQPQVITGDELAARIARSEPVADGIDIVARTLPAQKLALVRALQEGGEIVAVTGDGVNDVPALQAADIGIAMGERGTRSAREVASIVLLDDDFGSIVGAIAEGRRLFTNLQLSFQYLLMVHIPLVITAALIPMLGYPLLYLPIHIVWLELIIHPTALLVFQNLPSRQAMGPPPPRGTQPRFFDRREWWGILAVGAVVTLVVTSTYLNGLGADYAVDHARTVALLSLIFAGAGITAALSRLRHVAAWLMALAPPALSALLVHTPGLGTLLHLQPLHLEDWLLVLGGSLLSALLVRLGRFPSQAQRSWLQRTRRG
nr:cation-transporting P-type ATPase [Halomonas sp. MCCC 1A17488]